MRKFLVHSLTSWMLLLATLSACDLEELEIEKQRDRDDELISTYLKNHGIEAFKDGSGIYYTPLVENPEGRGVRMNDVVEIRYDIQTLEGKPLERTLGTGSTAVFLHDFQSIIPLGLDYGVSLMRQGEQYRFYIPSGLAYGNYSYAGLFDEHSIFIIDIQLEDILTISDVNAEEMDSLERYVASSGILGITSSPSGLYYKEYQEGSGQRPTAHSTVTFHFIRKYLDGTIIEQTQEGRPVTIPLGQNYAVAGLEEGLLKMSPGGKSVLIMPSQIAFGASVQVIPTQVRSDLINKNILLTRVLPFSPVMYEVELIDIE